MNVDGLNKYNPGAETILYRVQTKKRNMKMMIVAFAPKSSKVMANLLCKDIKHVAPIEILDDYMVMYQFVKCGHVENIRLKMRDINILRQHGWKFIYMPINMPYGFKPQHTITCVQMTKQAIGLKKWHIQTPGALYKFLN